MRRFCVLTWVLLACGGGGSASPGDAGVPPKDGATDAAVDAPSDGATPFTPVPPPANPLPAENSGGAVIATPSIVFLSYAGDANASAMASFLSWLPTSTYFTSTLGEYGISAGTYAGSYTFGTTVPTSYTLAQFKADLDAKIASGAFGTTSASSVYALLAPPGLQISDRLGGTTCQDFLGFHDMTPGGHPFALAFPCGFTLDSMTWTMSHEVAEIVTDPTFTSLTWNLLYMTVIGGELGDLCDNTKIVQDGYTVQRIFSNAAAASGQDPCVPHDPATTYIGVAPTDGTQPGAAAGSSVTTHWQAFATQRPPGPMKFLVIPDPALQVTVTPCVGSLLSGCAVAPGDTFAIDVTVKPDTLPGYRELEVITAAGSVITAQWNMRVATAPTSCDALAQDCPAGQGCQRWYDNLSRDAVGGCVAAGTGGPGATCNADNDCAPGLECAGGGTCIAYCGVCDPSNQNDPCSFANSYQASGTYCDPHGTNPTFCTQTFYEPDVNGNLHPTQMTCAPGCDAYSTSACTDMFGQSGACYVEYAGLRCAPAGSAAIGSSCNYFNDCAPGAECFGNGTCYQVCHAGSTTDCPSGTPCIDVSDANVSGIGACEPPCDIFHASSCSGVFGSGACYYESAGLVCERGIGNVAIGASCTYANDCAPGAMCLGSTCYQVCRVGAANACPSGKTCYDLKDSNAPGLGACD